MIHKSIYHKGGYMVRTHKELFFHYSLNQGLHWFSLGIIIPVMILAFLDFGFDIGQIGIAMAVMSTTVLLLELPTGGLADTLGRKRIYIIAVFFYVAGYSLLLFASAFIHLIAVVVLVGIGRALSSGTIDAWFIDEHKRLGGDDEHLQQDLAKAGIVIPAALGVGTLAGGFIPDITGSFRSNIVILIALYCLQMLLTAVLIKENRADFNGRLSDGFRQFPRVLSSAVKYGIRQRNTLVILIATAALGIGLSGLEQLWQPRVRGISPETGTWFLGVLSTGYFLAAAAGSGVSTGVLKLFRQNYGMFLFCFRLLMAVFYIALSFVFSLGAFMPLYFILFFFHGITGSPEMTIFNRDIPSGKRSSLLSLNSLFLQAGGVMGSVAAGQIALRLSIPAAWRLAGGLLAASAFVYLFIKEKVSENRI